MFGKNIVLKQVAKEDDGQTLVVNSIWPTIQGEGPNAGQPAIFVRLTGCNLRCHFCDTEFEKGAGMTIRDIAQEVKHLVETSCDTALVVLTGGEPMRQQIVPLMALLDDAGFVTQIETAGTLWPLLHEVHIEAMLAVGAVEIVCSPKTPKLHHKIIEWCEHFKYIIRMGEISHDDGLPVMSTQSKGMGAMLYRPDRGNVIPTIWVQPCAEYVDRGFGPIIDDVATQRNIELCAAIAMKYGYRVSLQQHKIMGVE